jgi:hypothetical protein
MPVAIPSAMPIAQHPEPSVGEYFRRQSTLLGPVSWVSLPPTTSRELQVGLTLLLRRFQQGGSGLADARVGSRAARRRR